jgi:hypothetical protein
MLTTFRINTCKSVSKQRTLTLFGINTYEKTGEGGFRSLPNGEAKTSEPVSESGRYTGKGQRQVAVP